MKEQESKAEEMGGKMFPYATVESSVSPGVLALSQPPGSLVLSFFSLRL